MIQAKDIADAAAGIPEANRLPQPSKQLPPAKPFVYQTCLLTEAAQLGLEFAATKVRFYGGKTLIRLGSRIFHNMIMTS